MHICSMFANVTLLFCFIYKVVVVALRVRIIEYGKKTKKNSGHFYTFFSCYFCTGCILLEFTLFLFYFYN